MNAQVSNWSDDDPPKAMSNIPPDLYERVLELALAITNSVLAGDEVLSNAHTLQLREYYEEQAGLGKSHPFLTETLADFTDDPTEAVRLYQLSIQQVPKFPDEPIHTKQISLARTLIEAGKMEQAEAYLRDGREAAAHCKDAEWIATADSLLQNIR